MVAVDLKVDLVWLPTEFYTFYYREGEKETKFIKKATEMNDDCKDVIRKLHKAEMKEYLKYALLN